MKILKIYTVLIMGAILGFSLPCFATGLIDPNDEENKVIHILSIDGGGIRGLIPATFLSCLEEKLEEYFSKPIPLSECFDVIAGTSTGGIIALGLSTKDPDTDKPRPAKELVDLYIKKGKDIFPPSEGIVSGSFQKIQSFAYTKFDIKPLEEILDEKFKEIPLQHTVTQVVIPAFDMRSNTVKIFNSKKANLLSENFSVKDVARSTASAPTFFEGAEITSPGNKNILKALVDGGVYANNPTLIAYREAQERFPKAKNFFIVSLGTGEEAIADHFDKLQHGGKIQWVLYIPTLMFKTQADEIEANMKSLQKLYTEKLQAEFKWIRINLSLHEAHTQMDNATKGNLQALSASGEKLFKSPQGNDVLKYLIQSLEKKGYSKGQKINDIILQDHIKNTGPQLDLSNRDIDNKSMETIIKSLQNNQNATSLNLSRNKITRESLSDIHYILKEYSTITTLDLSRNNLEESHSQLLNCFEDTSLTSLNLSKTFLDETSLAWILSLMNKKTNLNIVLTGNKIPDSMKQNIKNFMSKGRIVF